MRQKLMNSYFTHILKPNTTYSEKANIRRSTKQEGNTKKDFHIYTHTLNFLYFTTIKDR